MERLAQIAQLAKLPPRSSPIEYLHIENSSIHSKHVAMILRSMKALKELRLVFTPFRCAGSTAISECNEYRVPAVHYPTLSGAITTHYESLENLTLHSDLSLPPHIYYSAAVGCLQLQKVRDLQYLRTDVVTLYHDGTYELFNPLPPNIRRLDLDTYEPLWPYYRCPKASLLSIATDCAQKHPLLKEMRILRHTTNGLATWRAFFRIFGVVERAFESQRVTIKFYIPSV